MERIASLRPGNPCSMFQKKIKIMLDIYKLIFIIIIVRMRNTYTEELQMQEWTKKELKQQARDMLMQQIANIGYGDEYDEFISHCGSIEKANEIMIKEMDRLAKLLGYDSAWFN